VRGLSALIEKGCEMSFIAAEDKSFCQVSHRHRVYDLGKIE
jgi:hypothetical protein